MIYYIICRREALKTALSEKDAHLALLELTEKNTVSQSNQIKILRADKKKLLDRLKEQVIEILFIFNNKYTIILFAKINYIN